VTVDWHPGAAVPDGAERLWRVEVERAWRTPLALAFPFRSTFGGYAPSTLHTGVW
jgi:hypothetical protein